MITVNNKYPIASFVYLLTDAECLKRQVICIKIFPDKTHCYELVCGENVGFHFEVELTDVKPN